MILRGWMKTVGAAAVFTMLAAGGFIGIVVWPKMTELKEKDPITYAVMKDEATALHFSAARKLYQQIDAMSYEDVLTLRYRTWKEKADADRKFRWAEWEKELDLRKESRELQKKKYRHEVKLLQEADGENNPRTVFVDWQEAGPWERGLILREKCIKFLELEMAQVRRPADVRQVSRISRLLKGPRGSTRNVAEVCEGLVPIEHDARVVAQSLDNLKTKMNYYFFVQMLDEIGIPRKTVLPFPDQLEHMTGDFFDS